MEEWEDFVILQANFGSLTNRALAQLLGHIISEQTGASVAVQHDPYRIFVQTTGGFRAEILASILAELGNASPEYIEDTLTRACVKTGIFKRRMIHVARRFGALKKQVDLSNVTLRSLIRSFEGTIIYEEALKEVFSKDLDLKKLIEVFARMRRGEIKVVQVGIPGEPSPVARVGIERVSMKTDLIPPEKMRRILVEASRARLLDEARTFICTHCWDYVQMLSLKDLPEKPVCPKCGSPNLGELPVEEQYAYPLVDKRGERLTKNEEKLRRRAEETAKLISTGGKPAAVALAGRSLRIVDVKEILAKEARLSDEFYELVIEAERNALKRRFL